MKQSLSITILILLILSLTRSFGQTPYSSHNQTIVDSAKRYILKYCSSYGSSTPISKKKAKYDKYQIALLNSFYNKELKSKEIQEEIKKIQTRKPSFDTIKLGAVTKYETRIYSEGNLEIFISFSTYKENIVFKRIFFNTRTSTDCILPFQNGISQHDFKYLENNVIPLANFPFSDCRNCSYISCDTVFFSKLKDFLSAEHRFFLTQEEEYLNNLTWFKVDTYMLDFAHNDLIEIVEADNQELLLKLLYSPNHILSLYAMEGLIYLNETRKIQLPIDVQQKMEQVKNSDIRINIQYSDVIRRGFTYKDLKINKQKIITKFKQH